MKSVFVYCIISLFQKRRTELLIEALEQRVVYTINHDKLKWLLLQIPQLAKRYIGIEVMRSARRYHLLPAAEVVLLSGGCPSRVVASHAGALSGTYLRAGLFDASARSDADTGLAGNRAGRRMDENTR
ncbi:MAG: hypothetical protein LBJ01_03020 [Tannerella sp.]|jgi:hypothetical protein|nr:hypothetical protein [Tannerella sp.]